MKYFLSIVAAISLFLSAAVSAQAIDVNSAGPEALAAGISGVGPKLAAAIVEYRDQHGPFQDPGELENVKGIGPVLIENNRNNLVVTSD